MCSGTMGTGMERMSALGALQVKTAVLSSGAVTFTIEDV